MLTAYLDVSRGSEPVYVLAGYIASVGQWDRFKPKWDRMLSDYGVDVYAPADLDLKGLDGNRLGRYKGWSDEKASAFQRRAFAIVKEHRRVAMGSGIVTSDFHLKLSWTRKEGGLPTFYYVTALDLLKNVSAWAKHYKVREPIQYIFETGDDGYYEIERLFADMYKDPRRRDLYHIAGYSRQDKKKVNQLQAAGIWAYECYKYVVNQHLDGKKRPVRESWNALFRHYDWPFNTMWDKDNLPLLLKMYKDIGGLVG